MPFSDDADPDVKVLVNQLCDYVAYSVAVEMLEKDIVAMEQTQDDIWHQMLQNGRSAVAAAVGQSSSSSSSSLSSMFSKKMKKQRAMRQALIQQQLDSILNASNWTPPPPRGVVFRPKSRSGLLPQGRKKTELLRAITVSQQHQNNQSESANNRNNNPLGSGNILSISSIRRPADGMILSTSNNNNNSSPPLGSTTTASSPPQAPIPFAGGGFSFKNHHQSQSSHSHQQQQQQQQQQINTISRSAILNRLLSAPSAAHSVPGTVLMLDESRNNNNNNFNDNSENNNESIRQRRGYEVAGFAPFSGSTTTTEITEEGGGGGGGGGGPGFSNPQNGSFFGRPYSASTSSPHTIVNGRYVRQASAGSASSPSSPTSHSRPDPRFVNMLAIWQAETINLEKKEREKEREMKSLMGPSSFTPSLVVSVEKYLQQTAMAKDANNKMSRWKVQHSRWM